jgi:SAM-dependent methyltransferase
MQIVQSNDAFGAALMDYSRGKETHYVIERNDGLVDTGSLATYFTNYEGWSPIEKRMPKLVRGRVLDVGCGAGRHALYLQNLGFEVVGIDRSPLAIQIAKQRGLKQAHAISLDDLARSGEPNLGVFGSVIMMGHNLGLLHGWNEGKKILRGLARITSQNARIIGTTRAPGETNDPDHLAYQRWNREQGRMPGQLRLRIRHRKLVGEWFYYLFLSEEELRDLVKGTGWQLETVMKGDSGFAGAGSYLAVLYKE